MSHSIDIFNIQIDTKSFELVQQHQIVLLSKSILLRTFWNPNAPNLDAVRLIDTLSYAKNYII